MSNRKQHQTRKQYLRHIAKQAIRHGFKPEPRVVRIDNEYFECLAQKNSALLLLDASGREQWVSVTYPLYRYDFGPVPHRPI